MEECKRSSDRGAMSTTAGCSDLSPQAGDRGSSPAEGRRSGGTSLVKGAAVLAVAAVVSKLLGTLQKIPLQNLAGDEAFGIYNIVYPLYTLILTLATAGFPLTVSKFVTDEIAAGRETGARRVLAAATSILAVTGLLCFILLYGAADFLASALGAPSAAASMRSVSFALLAVPFMAALRGYFQGKRDMVPTAVSQVAEQTVRVATMIVLLLVYLGHGYGPHRIAAGAMFGSVTGGAAGLLVMLAYWRRESASWRITSRREAGPPAGVKWPGAFIRRFIRTAAAICLGTIALPVLTMVDSATLPRLLASAGMDEPARLYEVGLYNHAQPLVQLAALIAGSMSAALVPAIAESRALGRESELAVRTEFAIRSAWLIGLAASIGLAAAAVPINIMFYAAPDGSATMVILAFTAAFSVLSIVSGSILIGLGRPAVAAWSLLAAALIKTLLNLLLVPRFGVEGAAAGAVAAYAAAAGINLAVVRRRSGARFPAAAYVARPLAASAVMAAAVLAVRFGLEQAFGVTPDGTDTRAAYTVIALVCVLTGAAVYIPALLRFKALRTAELAESPELHRRIVPLLQRLRIRR